MNTFILDSDAGLEGQLDQCCTNIDDYVTPLGLVAAKVVKIKTTYAFVKFIFGAHAGIQAYAHGLTIYKDQLHSGPSKALMGAIPIPPAFPTILPTISLGNARAQFADLIQDCVRSNNFTRDIGVILGFMKTEAVEKEEEGTPNLSVKLTTGGHPILHAKKGSYQGYEVWKDVGDGKGYAKLDTSLYADYTDVSDLPAIGVGKAWKYKVIYVSKRSKCGNWSSEVTIGVFGLI